MPYFLLFSQQLWHLLPALATLHVLHILCSVDQYSALHCSQISLLSSLWIQFPFSILHSPFPISFSSFHSPFSVDTFSLTRGVCLFSLFFFNISFFLATFRCQFEPMVPGSNLAFYTWHSDLVFILPHQVLWTSWRQRHVLPGNQTLCVLDTTFIGQDIVMDNVQVNSLDIVYDRVVRQSSVKWSLAWATSLSPRTATQLWLWLDSVDMTKTWQRRYDIYDIVILWQWHNSIVGSLTGLDDMTKMIWHYDIVTLWQCDNGTILLSGCEMNVEGCDVGQVSRLWFFHDSPYHCDIWHMTWLRHYGQ